MQQHHVIPVKVYYAIFAALLVLTWVTVAIARVDLGQYFNTVAAMTIATGKAVLVVLYFMHVRYTTNLTKFVVAGGFVWLAIMISLVMVDYVSRTWL